ncbi:MAG: hypothetical protein NVS2B9_07000 [Myxococcales bacterium]
MRNETQSVADARRMRSELVATELELAVRAINKGEPAEARRQFGLASHPTQDHDATAHTNNQDEPLVWRGLNHPIDAKAHVDIDMAERLEGVRAQRAIRDTRALFNELRHRVLGDAPSPEAVRKWEAFTGISPNERPKD